MKRIMHQKTNCKNSLKRSKNLSNSKSWIWIRSPYREEIRIRQHCASPSWPMFVNLMQEQSLFVFMVLKSRCIVLVRNGHFVTYLNFIAPMLSVLLRIIKKWRFLADLVNVSLFWSSFSGRDCCINMICCKYSCHDCSERRSKKIDMGKFSVLIKYSRGHAIIMWGLLFSSCFLMGWDQRVVVSKVLNYGKISSFAYVWDNIIVGITLIFLGVSWLLLTIFNCFYFFLYWLKWFYSLNL